MVSTNVPTDQKAAATAHGPIAKPDRDPIAAPTGEQQSLTRIARALQAAQSDAVKFVVGDEPALDSPPSLLRVLRRGVATLVQGNAVTMGQVGTLLTIGQAAQLLMVSHASVTRLLDGGELGSVTEGQDRRIPLDHLLEYQAKIAVERRASLQELTRLSEELGLYDLDVGPTTLKRLAELDEEAEP